MPAKHSRTVPGSPNAYIDWWTGLHWSRNAVASGATIALVGDRGTGKTQIACELVRTNTQLSLTPWRCLYTRIAEMFGAIREAYGPSATTTERQVIARFVRPRLLILDEAHDRAHSPAEARLLNLILDTRYADEKATVFIANATPDEFREQVGESIFDRISETGGILECNWKSFRAKGRA